MRPLPVASLPATAYSGSRRACRRWTDGRAGSGATGGKCRERGAAGAGGDRLAPHGRPGRGEPAGALHGQARLHALRGAAGALDPGSRVVLAGRGRRPRSGVVHALRARARPERGAPLRALVPRRAVQLRPQRPRPARRLAPAGPPRPDLGGGDGRGAHAHLRRAGCRGLPAGGRAPRAGGGQRRPRGHLSPDDSGDRGGDTGRLEARGDLHADLLRVRRCGGGHPPERLRGPPAHHR